MTPYLELKKRIQECIPHLNTNNGLHVYYRGHSDNSWLIKPSICRNNDEKQNENRMLLEQLKNGNWDIQRSLFENIAHLQHYGIHTRFLDYTTNADVAIYFACEKHVEKDAEIIACAYDLRSLDYRDTIIITELALLKEPIIVSDFVQKIVAKYPELKRKDNSYISLEEDLGLSVLSWIDHGFMVTPSLKDYEHMKEWNPRIWNQKGAFFVPGNKTVPPFPKPFSRSINTTTILPEIADIPSTITHCDYIYHFHIPKDQKTAILEELATEKGINRSFIYPDLSTTS